MCLVNGKGRFLAPPVAPKFGERPTRNWLSAVYSLRVLCQCYSCTATILSDVNCTSKWVVHSNKASYYNTRHHRSAATLLECQKACEFDPRCVSVDWRSPYDDGRCDLSTETNHRHYSTNLYDHYELVSRCNITPG